MPCSYLVNSLPPASRPSFSVYRVVSPSNNYDYGVTLFALPSPSLRGMALGISGAGVLDAGAPPAPEPPGSVSPGRTRRMWIALLAVGGAGVSVAAAALARRARILRAAHALKKGEKIPATRLVAVV